MTTTPIIYESCWLKKTVMNIRLINGQIEVVYSDNQKLSNAIPRAYNDWKWYHVAVSMPKSKCMLSMLQIFVDGMEISTELVGDDTRINFNNGSMLAIGGIGHGGICAKNGVHERNRFRSGGSFIGKIDDVFVWSRSLSLNDIERVSKEPVTFTLRTKLSYQRKQAFCVGTAPGRDIKLKECNKSPWQKWQIDSTGYMHSVANYKRCLNRNGTTLQLVRCNSIKHDTR